VTLHVADPGAQPYVACVGGTKSGMIREVQRVAEDGPD